MNAPASKPAPAAHLTRIRLLSILGALTILLVVCAIAGLLFGTAHISLTRAFSDPDSPDHAIFFAARLPRVLMGVIVGAMLAAVGTALQALVRNPLAEGGILGISGGGALGAILALVMSAKLGGGEALVPLCAFGAALLSTVAVYRLAMVDGQLEPFTLLLVGVIFNAFWGAAIMLVNSVVNFYYAHSILFWLMGSLEAPTYGEAATVESRAVANAQMGTSASPPPSFAAITSARIAPSAPPPEIPRIPPSASGLRTRACRAVPTAASIAPTITPINTRGKRAAKRIA